MKWLKVMALVVTALISASGANGQDTTSDYEKLLNSEIFAFGSVGFAGRVSDAEVAFNNILAGDQAVETFKKLLAEAKPGGQLYALYGLYLKDRKAFEHQVAQFRAGLTKDQVILIQRGCTILSENTRDLISRIESGNNDFMFMPASGTFKK